eukprot:maker-scaffold367_size194084-snap-gene-0.44 protein:Tk00503 transcript:maker-scaffold367_size194084-snap-gene-0.44-mRNA-1 annotation:"laminin subunit alpha-2"
MGRTKTDAKTNCCGCRDCSWLLYILFVISTSLSIFIFWMSLYKFQEYHFQMKQMEHRRNLTVQELVDANVAHLKSGVMSNEALLRDHGRFLQQLNRQMDQYHSPDPLPDYEYDTLLERIDNFQRQYGGAMNWIHNKLSKFENETLLELKGTLSGLRSQVGEGEETNNAHTKSINDIKGRIEQVWDLLESITMGMDVQNRSLAFVEEDIEALKRSEEARNDTEWLHVQEEILQDIAQLKALDGIRKAEFEAAEANKSNEMLIPLAEVEMSIANLTESYEEIQEFLVALNVSQIELEARLEDTEEKVVNSTQKLDSYTKTVEHFRQNVLKVKDLPGQVMKLQKELQTLQDEMSEMTKPE